MYSDNSIVMKFINLIQLLGVVLVSCSNISNSSKTSVKLLALNGRINGSEIVGEISRGKKPFVGVGEEVVFTIELEDPNFEFISLLSIQFNSLLLRANTDDSIFNTRDCNQNICIDFPFIIEKSITTYTVDAVRFAKLNFEEGVNAIINESSNNSVTFDLFEGDEFPNVIRSVNAINTLIAMNPYKELNAIIEEITSANSHREFVKDLFYSRTLKLITYSVGEDPLTNSYFELGNPIYFPTELDEVLGYNLQNIGFFHGSDYTFLFDLYNDDRLSIENDFSFLNNDTFHFYFGLLDDSFINSYAFNDGNTIYISVKDMEYKIRTMLHRDDRIELLKLN